MKKQYLFLLIVAGLITFFSACKKELHYDALIITGQNNHNWQASNPILKLLLDQTGIFTTDIIITPEKGGDMTTFHPKFSDYDVIVLDYNGDSWTDNTNEAFLEYVRSGGGVVVYHAADNAFPEWEEYNKIIGLGGWGDRDEKSGPYVYYKGDVLVRDDTSAGIGGTHGPRSEFLVKTRDFEHPITKGLPANWLHGKDELYSLLRGPAENMEILATAFSPTRVPNQNAVPVNRRAGRDEPILMTISYGKGRIFHTVLGHADDGGGPAMQCVGFIATFQRGAEWAASGEVTQAVPIDFPNAAGVVLRPDFKQITFEDVMANIGSYEIEKSTKYYTFLNSHIRSIAGDEKALLDLEKSLVKVLTSSETTVDAKKQLLRELSWMGSDYSLPAIKDLVSNEDLKDEAEFALSRLQPAK